MKQSIEDFTAFVKDSWFLALTTTILVGLMIYFITSTMLAGPAQPSTGTGELPSVPDIQIAPIENISSEQESPKDAPKKEILPAIIVPVRPAQIGVPDMQASKGAAFEVVNSIKEAQSIPKDIKIAISFYVISVDGSKTHLPESNLSLTIEGGGRIRNGIAQGSNVRIKMPATRLEDMKTDLCQALKDMIQNDEIEYDLSEIGAIDKFQLVSTMLPVANRCGIA